ncbi:molybdopterin-dependent oxidoreductase [Paraburkholderia sediminicola]|uniref:xanthine dehydrogenase family protein molybdopterin-binding subunit n=1 Tax=Paraburkholderia sediminicola TaxID=458836 RepID=UPI0038BCEB6C
MTASISVSRRAFLGSAVGLTFAFAFGLPSRSASARPNDETTVAATNLYVSIAPSGEVTIQSPASEMGQGVMTSLARCVAEDLDADWSKVRVVQAPASERYGNPLFGGLQITGSSNAVAGYYLPLRLAGAQARRVLLNAVAQRWSVPVSELATRPGHVMHRTDGRQISYGEIAVFATVPSTLPAISKDDLKPATEFRLIGQPGARVDLHSKVNGSAGFGIDASMPGMLYGVMLRGPAPGDKVGAVDDIAARKVPGVIDIVPFGDRIGVVANNTFAALSARNLLNVKWTNGAAHGYSSDHQLALLEQLAHDADPGIELHRSGDASAALDSATRTVDATYQSDHLYQATMEPMTALANVVADTVSIHAPTQSPSVARQVVAAACGFAPEKITIEVTLLGGGFGRRLEVDYVVDAVLLSKAAKRPVRILWARENDVRNGFYRPLAAQRLRAGIDASGQLQAWTHRIVSDSIYARFSPPLFKKLGGKDPDVTNGYALGYRIPHQAQAYKRIAAGFPVGFWRAVAPGYVVFAVESFIDEVALATGREPLEFRLDLLRDSPRAVAVVSRAADMADWSRKRPDRALGIAFSQTWNTFVAQVAEVSLDKDSGQIKVHQVWCAVDPGVVVSPDIVTAQIEGAVAMGVSAALIESVAVEDGQVMASNFHDYPVLRMADMPRVSVDIVPTGHPPGGMGEVGLPPVAPAIANAVAALSGVRLRHLPMKPARVKQAINA